LGGFVEGFLKTSWSTHQYHSPICLSIVGPAVRYIVRQPNTAAVRQVVLLSIDHVRRRIAR